MNKLTLEARAKINLTLDIVNKREDGFHNVSMVMQTISLCDTLHFKVIEKGIKLNSNNPRLPKDERNIIYKSAKLLLEQTKVDKGIEVYVKKRIPIAAGLAGGSSNAASTIIALNKLWNLNLEDKSILEIGAKIGADVPFCMIEGTALAEGVGDVLTNLDPLPKFYVVLVKTSIRISTPWAYSLVNVKSIKNHPENLKMIEGIQGGDVQMITSKMRNVFEDFIFKKYPRLTDIKEKMIRLGALNSLMSGSGPTIYGLFEDEKTAKNAYSELKKSYKEVFIATTYNKGGLYLGV
ncbi:4-(cytidine 5'-diphospho)-2-C-methyl-D-erythritol kinase [Alkalibaculum bacchi]|uniref:4-(cytidine 5'-diphospho)-2-C-methyl-D-erythritol kinase n=1 Tax=Alkalibaculum bacchi TaxID=645887 RepID=UPI0026E9C26B|nr:4-(cytidine 5'-diphospho)-2-C-methyl-D-erythritol kinase [Alkalibaculum bacchi]